MPGIIISALLVAVGAILRFAVTDTVDGVDLLTIGLIVMLVGVACFVVSLIFANPWRSRTRVEQLEDDHGRGYRRVEKITDAGV